MPYNNNSKIYRLENSNGIFLAFNDYEYEEDFPLYLDFLASRLNIPRLVSLGHPYSQTALVRLTDCDVIAMYHDDTGCCLLIPLENRPLADSIAELCYPLQE